MLAWNHRRLVLTSFALWVISFLPFLYYRNTHIGVWSDAENWWASGLLCICAVVDAIGFSCLLLCISSDADKFSDE
jgi:hypothetical protein